MFNFLRIRRACLALVAAGTWMIFAGFGLSAAERKHPVCETLMPWHKHSESVAQPVSPQRLESDAPAVTPETEADKRVRQAELARVFESTARRQKIEQDRADEQERRLRSRRSSRSSTRFPQQHRHPR